MGRRRSKLARRREQLKKGSWELRSDQFIVTRKTLFETPSGERVWRYPGDIAGRVWKRIKTKKGKPLHR